MELNKEDAIDKEVAAEAEGALTPIEMDIFVKYNSRHINSTKCMNDAMKQGILLEVLVWLKL